MGNDNQNTYDGDVWPVKLLKVGVSSSDAWRHAIQDNEYLHALIDPLPSTLRSS